MLHHTHTRLEILRLALSWEIFGRYQLCIRKVIGQDISLKRSQQYEKPNGVAD